MLSQRTYDAMNSITTFVIDSKQLSTTQEFIRTSYNFSQLLVRLFILLFSCCFCLGIDLSITCYKLTFSLYLKFQEHISSMLQSSSSVLGAKKIDYFPQTENEPSLQERSQLDTNNSEPDRIWLDVDGEPHDFRFDPNYDSKWWRDDDDTNRVANDADRDRATVAKLSERTV